MPLHRTSGNWRLGLVLSLITVGLWGLLPVALAITLQELDIYTTIWFRFLLSFVLMVVYLGVRHQQELRQGKIITTLFPSRLSRSAVWLMAIATAGVALEYLLYLAGLSRTSPANAEVLIQLAPVMVGFGAIVIFGERYRLQQWVGVGVLTLGFVLFFNNKLQVVLTTPAEYWLGSGLILLSAIAWASYALAQKQLLQSLSSEVIMLIIYGICALVFTPFAHPAQILRLDSLHLSALLFSSINTLIAYSTFAESLEHWEASKISAMLSITPMLTLGSVTVTAWLRPDLMQPERITLVGLLGAGLVVGGSMLVTLGRGDEQVRA